MIYKIKEIGNVITGKTPSTKNKNNFNNTVDQYMFITPRDMNINSKYIYETERYLTNEIEKSFKNLIINNGDICISCIGTIGKVFIPLSESIANQQINSIRNINASLCDKDFLYYKLLTMEKQLKSIAGGTTVPILNKSTFENIEVELPDIDTQKKVGKILSELDNKIELNNQINDNLQEFNNELFKNWFIDFEFPNKEGKPYKTSGGKMIDSELGKIPFDWEVVELSSLTEQINGYSYKGSELVEESNVGMATIKNFDRKGGFKINGYKPLEPSKEKQQHYIEKFEVAVAHTDLTQNADIIGNPIMILHKGTFEKIIISMDVVKVVPTDDRIDNFLLFDMLNSKEFKNHSLGYVSGTTVLHLNKNAIKEYKIALPTNAGLCKQYSEIVSKNYNKNSNLLHLNQTLERIRDALLPKLMNGEIDLENIEI